MHKTWKLNGEGVITLSNCFLSEILIWDSYKNYSEKLPKEHIHVPILLGFFQSAETKTIKDTFIYKSSISV